MPSVRRYVVPFAAGVAVGVALHRYWPEIRRSAGPRLDRVLARGSGFVDRARTSFWEQSEKFSDLIAEIREEDEAATKRREPEPSP